MCARVKLSRTIDFIAAPVDNSHMATRKTYNVSDGKLVLTLTEAEEGGYIVTSPMDPELITEAETIEEAFEMARDALKALRESRAKWIKQLHSISR